RTGHAQRHRAHHTSHLHHAEGRPHNRRRHQRRDRSSLCQFHHRQIRTRHHSHPAGPRPLRQGPRRRARPRLWPSRRNRRRQLRSCHSCKLRRQNRLPHRPHRAAPRRHPAHRQRRHPLRLAQSQRLRALRRKLRPGQRRPLRLPSTHCRPHRDRLRHHGRRRHRRPGRRQNPPRRQALRQVLVGPRRGGPHRRPPASPAPHRHRPHRRLHPLSHHPQKFAQLPPLLPPRRRPHRLERQDRHAKHRAQHRRHRPSAVPQHHHHPLLHPHR